MPLFLYDQGHTTHFSCHCLVKGLASSELDTSVLFTPTCPQWEFLTNGLLGSRLSIYRCEDLWLGLKVCVSEKRNTKERLNFSLRGISLWLFKKQLGWQNHHDWLPHLRGWISFKYIHFILLNGKNDQVRSHLHIVWRTIKKTLLHPSTLLVISPPFWRKSSVHQRLLRDSVVNE